MSIHDSLFSEPVRGGRSWAVYVAFCEEAGINPSETGYRECCSLGVSGFLDIDGDMVSVQCVADSHSPFLYAPENKVEKVRKFSLKTGLAGLLVIPFEGQRMDQSASVSARRQKAEFIKTTI